MSITITGDGFVVALCISGGLALFFALIMFVWTAYHPIISPIIARFPVIGPSQNKYDLPRESESDQLQNLPVTPGYNILVDRTGDSPAGEAIGVSIEISGIRVLGAPVLCLTEPAFEDDFSQLAELISHEWGHHVHNDQLRNALYITVLTFLMFYTPLSIISAAFFTSPAVFISSLASFIGLFVMIRRYLRLSREAEYDADEFAAQQLDSPKKVIKWLKTLNDNESDNDDSSALWSRIWSFIFRYWNLFWERHFGETHPTPDERINELRDRFEIGEKCMKKNKTPHVEIDELPAITTVPTEKAVKASVLQQPNSTDDVATIKIESRASRSFKEKLKLSVRAVLVFAILITVSVLADSVDIMTGIFVGIVAALTDSLLGISSVIRELRE